MGNIVKFLSQAWTEAPSIASALVSMLLRLPTMKFVIVTLGEDGCIMIERSENGEYSIAQFLLLIRKIMCLCIVGECSLVSVHFLLRRYTGFYCYCFWQRVLSQKKMMLIACWNY